MMTIETLHELTGEVIKRKDNVASLQYRLQALDTTQCVSGKTTIQIGDVRSSFMVWLTREEIRIVLSRMLNDEIAALGIAQIQYAQATEVSH